MRRQKQENQAAWLALHAWYHTTLGRLFAATERVMLDRLLAGLFGYHSLALGLPGERDLLAASPIVRRYRMEIDPALTVQEVDVWTEPARLPVAADSMDVVVVAHLLEFSADPQAVLRELDRVLIPEGHLVLLGFNPWSWWGLPRLWLYGSQRGAPWQGACRSTRQWQMQLQSLGFDIVATHYHFYRPPLARSSWLERLAFLERWGTRGWGCGGGYVLLAKKRVSTLTPIRPRWRPRRQLATESIVNGALRGADEHH